MKHRFSFVVISILAIAAAAHAQPDTLWTRTFGGSGGDYCRSVQQTDDGGFIFAGYTTSFGAGQDDIYLIKTDASGTEQWSRTFGGTGHEYGFCVQQTSDGGYIIVGNTSSFGAGNYDIYLVKTDTNGIEDWNQTFGSVYGNYGYSVQQTLDGGYIIAGATSYHNGSSDVYLVKADSSGTESWSRTYSESFGDAGWSVQQTDDGGYIIAGETDPGTSDEDLYLIKTDADGDELWSRTFGGSFDDHGFSVQQTTDGGYIITGQTWSFGAGQDDVYLVKTDANGNESWNRTFGGSDHDYGRSVRQTSDGGYIISGTTYSFEGGSSVYLIKTDESGNESWSRTFGGSQDEYGYCARQTDNGGYIVAGETWSYGAGLSDVYLIRVEAEVGVLQGDGNNVKPSTLLLGAHPNPFNPITVLSYRLSVASRINLSVFDVSGYRVAELVNGWRDAGVHEVTFDGSGLASGVYLYRLETTESGATPTADTRKMVLVK